MTTKLKLKGNSLLLYAIIYGFCQDGRSYFHGSLNYLEEWSNSTRQGVINTLKDLVNKGLIIKEPGFPNNKYYINRETLNNLLYNDVNRVNNDVNKFDNDVNKVYNECKESLQNNIEYNKVNNKDNITEDTAVDINTNVNKKDSSKYTKEKELNSNVEQIITHFNSICDTKYRSNTAGTKKVIKARLNEGFSLQDFYDVIEYKYEEWGRTPVRFSNGQISSSYLRPSTLFGNKMEEYLQQAHLTQTSEGFSSIKSAPRSQERSGELF